MAYLYLYLIALQCQKEKSEKWPWCCVTQLKQAKLLTNFAILFLVTSNFILSSSSLHRSCMCKWPQLIIWQLTIPHARAQMSTSGALVQISLNMWMCSFPTETIGSQSTVAPLTFAHSPSPKMSFRSLIYNFFLNPLISTSQSITWGPQSCMIKMHICNLLS